MRVVVLISGRGSNLQAILEAVAAGTLPVMVAGVISNNPGARGLAHARDAGIPVAVIDHHDYARRDDFEAALMQAIDAWAPGLVVLAGFMRILGPGFIRRYHGRLMNIHPSLLPALPGLRTHERALEERHREHGATVHFVVDQVDGGPVIAQVRVPVQPDDTAASLEARVLAEEHRLYPRVIRWFAEGRLSLHAGTVMLDGAPVAQVQR